MLSKVLAATILSGLALAAPMSKRQNPRHISKIYASNGQCLGFTESQDLYNGTPVGNVDCNSDAAIEWMFFVGEANHIYPGTNPNFVLDAGSDPHNFGKLHLWQPYENLFQQTWWYTTDNRIAIYNGDQCIDDGNGGQTYQCTTGNTNQVWLYDGEPGHYTCEDATTTTVTVTATPTATSS
ncbi:ricin B lectin domain-containing protein [Kockovaella imperatae]|uniref:Ricin B lectin domain-containing protein n=1 Tax=Kockovaella imperatae TaxID=4999 RepID=A0A1Y1U6U4_9TREE|nr:ricin B lectin domain-containing protein [Kockovaella imperatae]ORX33254.1 ricin B lectin domain-containing protein [Kockovaella imperatae]